LANHHNSHNRGGCGLAISSYTTGGRRLFFGDFTYGEETSSSGISTHQVKFTPWTSFLALSSPIQFEELAERGLADAGINLDELGGME
jgi:hypothetical protein